MSERPQLFNMEQDPGEWEDLAEDPAHEETVRRLLAKVLDGWDAERIEREVERLMPDVKVLVEWGRAVKPECPDHWSAPPGSNVFPEK